MRRLRRCWRPAVALLSFLLPAQALAQVPPPLVLVDSLTKYAGGADLLFQLNDSVTASLFVGQVHELPFAIWSPALTDTSFVLFQQVEGQWVATDTVPYVPDAVRQVDQADVNGDGKLDIRVSFLEGVAGNRNSMVLLYEGAAHRLRFNPAYSLYNVDFDALTRRVVAGFFSGTVHCQEKQAYRIDDDSLVFEAGAEYCPDDKFQRATLTIFSKDRRVISSTKGRVPVIWQRFERAVWDSSPWPDH